jgi:hypothetical protein
VALLEDQKASNEGIATLLPQMKELKTIFDGIQVKSGDTKVSTDKEKGVTTIGNDADFTVSDEQLKQISEKTAAIRNKIIQ